MWGVKVCERRQPANKEPPPQQHLKKEKNKESQRKEGATWQKYCTGIGSTPGGRVRGEKEDEMESYKIGNPKG